MAEAYLTGVGLPSEAPVLHPIELDLSVSRNCSADAKRFSNVRSRCDIQIGELQLDYPDAELDSTVAPGE